MSSKNKKKRRLGALRGLLPFVRPYRNQVALALVFLLLGAGSMLALPIAIRFIVDYGFSGETAGDINKYFAILAAVSAVMVATVAFRFYWVSWLGERVVADIRKAVFDRVIRLDRNFFETLKPGEVLSRLNTDTTVIETVVGSSFSIALRSTIMFIGATTMLIVTSPSLAGITGLLIPCVIVPLIVLGKKLRLLSRRNQDAIAAFSAHADETIHAVGTVQAFAQASRESNDFSASVERAFRVAVRRIQWDVVLALCIMMILFLGLTAVLWLGAQQVITGTMTAGTLSQFVVYAVIVGGSAGALSQVYGDIQRAAGATERLMELLAAKSSLPSVSCPRRIERPRGEIVFEDVRFAYPSRPERDVLRNISFQITPGETVALVGPSGAGKSTIFQLLQRFYDPTSGRILFDGNDIRELDLDAYRSIIGVVPQESTIFSTTAERNIAYGAPDAAEPTIKAAAERAFADEFLAALPSGYEEELGEKGVRLSGGQRQRLSIARALMIDPALLLLDEATSNLDAESERRIQQALEQLRGSRTLLIIAHRLATVRSADRIFVIDDGRIIAEGDHDALVERSELYSNLAQLQFAA